jgi:acyl-CoA thioesterase YciA
MTNRLGRIKKLCVLCGEKNMEEKEHERRRNAAIRLTMMPRDTNHHGTIFGGVILSYIDVAGGVEAVRRTGHDRFVTVAMKEVIFHEPVFVGDLVSFYAETEKIGNTSITIRVIVEAERFGSRGQIVRVTEAEVVFVAINQNREKIRIRRMQND